jgi:hypothetical protein
MAMHFETGNGGGWPQVGLQRGNLCGIEGKSINSVAYDELDAIESCSIDTIASTHSTDSLLKDPFIHTLNNISEAQKVFYHVSKRKRPPLWQAQEVQQLQPTPG